MPMLENIKDNFFAVLLSSLSSPSCFLSLGLQNSYGIFMHHFTFKADESNGGERVG